MRQFDTSASKLELPIRTLYRVMEGENSLAFNLA